MYTISEQLPILRGSYFVILMSFSELLKIKKFRYLLLSLLLIIPLEGLSLYSIHLPLYIELPIFIGLAYVFGRDIFKSGFQSLMRLNFADINLLMTIAVIGAAYLGEFEEAVIVIVLFALGEALQDLGIEKSQSALEELIKKTPKSALLKGNSEKTPIEQIKLGDILIIKPGDYIPLDGEVIKGESLVDEAAITGEPLPKNKYLKDRVFAGSVNGQGYLEIRVTKLQKDTTLAKIIDLTFKSAAEKSKSQQFIEKFAALYTPAVVVISVLIVVIPVFFLGQPLAPWLTQALTVLIISCPCALVISTPVSIFSAIGNATKKGILIKGGRFIEEVGKIKAIAFDKTRTLTKGEPVVSDIVAFNGFTKEDVLACASGLESFSEHPLAKSIISKAEKEKLAAHGFKNFKSVMGKGVSGECNICLDKHHCLGTLKFITQEHKVADEIIKQVEKFEREGKTTIVMSEDKKVVGVIAITDEIREESNYVIKQLVQIGVTPVMLTGDNKSAAYFVAIKLGIGEVRASLLPDQKVEEVAHLLKKYQHVAMVGDGVNDAPALASSSVGIAMGAIGSDLAVENADIALMNNNIGLIPGLINLGKKTVQTIKFNTFLAVFTKFIFLVLAVLGISNLPMAIFADVGITILIVFISLRLFNFNIK